MVDDIQNSSLQQSGGGAATGNPQQAGQPGLQNQAAASLQPGGIFSTSAFNQLDQGSTKISVVNSSSTSQSTVAAVVDPTPAKPVLAYVGVGIIAAVILAGIIYGLRRQK